MLSSTSTKFVTILLILISVAISGGGRAIMAAVAEPSSQPLPPSSLRHRQQQHQQRRRTSSNTDGHDGGGMILANHHDDHHHDKGSRLPWPILKIKAGGGSGEGSSGGLRRSRGLYKDDKEENKHVRIWTKAIVSSLVTLCILACCLKSKQSETNANDEAAPPSPSADVRNKTATETTPAAASQAEV